MKGNEKNSNNDTILAAEHLGEVVYQCTEALLYQLAAITVTLSEFNDCYGVGPTAKSLQFESILEDLQRYCPRTIKRENG